MFRSRTAAQVLGVSLVGLPFLFGCVSDRLAQSMDRGMREGAQAAQNAVVSVSFSPDAQYVIGGSMNGTVTVWDLSRYAVVQRFTMGAARANASRPSR